MDVKSELYLTLKDEHQVEFFETVLKGLSHEGGLFNDLEVIYSPEDNTTNLVLNKEEQYEGEFEEDLERLSDIVTNYFDTEIKGYFIAYLDGNMMRGEVLNGKVVYQDFNWLKIYTVDQIQQLKEYAEKMWPKQLEESNSEEM